MPVFIIYFTNEDTKHHCEFISFADTEQEAVNSMLSTKQAEYIGEEDDGSVTYKLDNRFYTMNVETKHSDEFL